MIKGIIFDLGSTLMYFDGKWEELDRTGIKDVVAFLNERGFATPDDFHARFIEHRKAQWQRAEEHGIEARVGDAISNTLAELGHAPTDGVVPHSVEIYFAPFMKYWHAYPDALDTIKALHSRGLKIALISNADDEALIYRWVERLGFAPYMNPVLSSAAEPRWRKPDPRIFHLVSNAWQLPPAQIAMVGDATRYDIVGAHNAGMRGILINYGDNSPWQKIPDEFVNHPHWQPDATVHALAEIPTLVERWQVE